MITCTKGNFREFIVRPYRLSCAWLCLAALLTACGGGGGPGNTPPSTTAISGLAMDGYLENATAFADCNDDGLLSTDEPRVRTAANGSFTLQLTDAQKSCHIVVLATAGVTKDADTGTTISQDFKLLTPPVGTGSTSVVVSPLTTQVVAAMQANSSLSLTDAQTQVKTSLGLGNIDLMADFIARKNSGAADAGQYAQAHNLAVAITQVLQDVNTANTDLGTALASLRTQIVANIVPHIATLKSANGRAAVLAALAQATAPEQAPTVNGVVLGGTTASLFDPVAKLQTLTNTYAKQTLTFSSAQLSKANLLELVDGVTSTGTIPTLTLDQVTTGSLPTLDKAPITISLQSSGLSLTANFVVTLTSTPAPALILPAQTVSLSGQGMGLTMDKQVKIGQQDIPLMSINSTLHSASINAMHLLTLLNGQTFNYSNLNLSASDAMTLMLALGNSYTVTVDLGQNTPLYDSQGNPLQRIVLPVQIN